MNKSLFVLISVVVTLLMPQHSALAKPSTCSSKQITAEKGYALYYCDVKRMNIGLQRWQFPIGYSIEMDGVTWVVYLGNPEGYESTNAVPYPQVPAQVLIGSERYTAAWSFGADEVADEVADIVIKFRDDSWFGFHIPQGECLFC